MAEVKKENIVLGELVAVRKKFTDKTTGEVREYYGYQVEFENGAIVRFLPMQDDRSLLRFAMQDLTAE